MVKWGQSKISNIPQMKEGVSVGKFLSFNLKTLSFLQRHDPWC